MSPNDLGKKFTVEDCRKIAISTILATIKQKLKEVLITSELEASGLSLKLITSKTGFGGIRYWFQCPICGQRVGTLFVHPINHTLGCRICLRLEYRKRIYKGMLESKDQ